MSVKTLVVPIALTLSFTVSPIYATPWTVTTTGTISSGYDLIGLFGAAYQNLAGAPYTLTITTDPNLNADSFPGGNSTTGGTYYGYYGAPITATAMVNGISITDIIDPNIKGVNPGDDRSGQNIQAIYHETGYFRFDSIQSSNSGYNQSITAFIMADIIVSNYVNPTILSSESFNQSLTYTIQAGDETFVYWNHASSYFQGVPTLLSINPSNTPIPIPPTILLVGSGLVGLFGLARRKPT